MLEYLFKFIENNILIIFICVLGLAIASVFSKKIKVLFVLLLSGASIYFALLCLYRLGIGIDTLYIESGKVVITLCEWFERYKVYFIHSDMLLRISKPFVSPSLQNFIYEIIGFVFLLASVFIVFELCSKVFERISFKKIEINARKVSKKIYLMNTIKEEQPKFIMNSCFRC